MYEPNTKPTSPLVKINGKASIRVEEVHRIPEHARAHLSDLLDQSLGTEELLDELRFLVTRIHGPHSLDKGSKSIPTHQRFVCASRDVNLAVFRRLGFPDPCTTLGGKE